MDLDQFNALTNATAGAAASVFSTSVLFPLDCLKIKVSATISTDDCEKSRREKKGIRGLLKLGKRVVREEGVPGLYAGLPVRVTQQAVQKFVYFYLFRALKDRAEALGDGSGLSAAATIVVGYLAGVGNATSCLPLEIVANRELARAAVQKAACNKYQIIRTRSAYLAPLETKR